MAYRLVGDGAEIVGRIIYNKNGIICTICCRYAVFWFHKNVYLCTVPDPFIVHWLMFTVHVLTLIIMMYIVN